MNIYKQKVAIAEACGATWVNVPPQPENGFSSEYHPKRLLTFKPNDLRILPLADPKTHDSILVPDYLNDLNAMHEALAYLKPEQVDQFAAELTAIVLENDTKAWWDLNMNEVGHVINATAAQHAEAFLRTLDLWKDEA